MSVSMTFMKSPGLRRFWGTIFFFKFAVHFLRIGREDFGSDDIYEVPRPQTIFLYKKKIQVFGDQFFKFAVHYLRNGPEDFGSDDIYEVPMPQTIFLYTLNVTIRLSVTVWKIQPFENT